MLCCFIFCQCLSCTARIMSRHKTAALMVVKYFNFFQLILLLLQQVLDWYNYICNGKSIHCYIDCYRLNKITKMSISMSTSTCFMPRTQTQPSHSSQVNNEILSHLFTRPVSSYPPASSHSPSLSLFHPLFFPLWVCSLWKAEGNIIILTAIGYVFCFMWPNNINNG